jgi:hypothetical protein
MKDKVEFEEALKSDDQLNDRFHQLKMMHDTLKASKLESPGRDFTARVMRNLSYAPAKLSMSPKNGLMLLLGISVALTLGVIFLSTGTFDQITGVLTLDKLNVPKSVMPKSLPSIPFNASLIMKILVGLNLAIAFVLIDKTILQPYFRNRNKKRLI